MVENLTSTGCSQTPQLEFDVLKAFSGLLQHIEVSSCKSASSVSALVFNLVSQGRDLENSED
jgi:hypothetical protein